MQILSDNCAVMNGLHYELSDNEKLELELNTITSIIIGVNNKTSMYRGVLT